jgi:capsid protein
MIYTGATAARQFADWVTSQPEPEAVWRQDAYTLGARGLSLVCNDPIAAAMCNAYVQGIHGPLGLRLESAYDTRPDRADTTGRDRRTRRAITSLVADTWFGTGWDAGGLLTRREMERALSWTQFAIGDAWAIRVFKPDRPDAEFATCWRLIPPHRVSNLDGQQNSEDMRDGVFYRNGNAAGIFVETSPITARYSARTWTKINWWAEDGTPNVVHRCGPRLLGMSRGVTMMAPAIMTMRQSQQIMEAHVMGKRIQAMYPMIFKVGDPEAFKAYQEEQATYTPGMVMGPTSTMVIGSDDEITLPDVKYDGADFKECMLTIWRPQCAAIGFPLEVVLAMMGDASLASAKAGLDLFDRQCQTHQEDAIDQVSRPFDRSRIGEAIATNDLAIPAGTPWSQIMAGEYTRPPKFSVDRKKDMETVKAAIEAGASKTTAFKLVGMRYEDEIENQQAEAEFDAAQNATTRMKADQSFIERIKASQETITALGLTGVTWPAVIAANGAETAPGAYIAAVGQSVVAEKQVDETLLSSDASQAPSPANTSAADSSPDDFSDDEDSVSTDDVPAPEVMP